MNYLTKIEKNIKRIERKRKLNKFFRKVSNWFDNNTDKIVSIILTLGAGVYKLAELTDEKNDK